MNYLYNAFTRIAVRPSVFLRKLFGGLCLLLTGLLSTASLGQTTYYVATNGNDNNDGRSPNSALQSLAKVNALPLLPGDQVLFRRGDTFRGSLTIRRSGSAAQPILFDAFGSGQRPVLAASAVVSGWSSLGGNLWQASCAACGNRVTGLYRNGEDLPLGRYPNLSEANKGYLTIGSHQGESQLTSQQGLPLNLNTGWAGAEVVVRATQWIMDRYGLGGQSGSTLSLSGDPSGYGISDSWGFFVQNHPATLDQVGEWAFESNARVFRLYSTSNPNEQLITATVQATAVDVTNVTNVTVRNLRLSESLNAGLFVNNGSNLTFSSVEVVNSGEDGVAVIGSGSNVLIENCTILNSHNNGVTFEPYSNVTFRGSQIRDAGVIPGRGLSGDGHGNGMRITGGQNILIEDNVIDNIGYNGITYSTSTTIRRNIISNFCRTKSDGGGVYTWNGNRNNVVDIRVQNNIVSNGIGAPEGTPGGAYSGANGIFFDDCSQNAEVSGNTVFGCHGLGIYLRAASSININNNTTYDNREGQLQLAYNGACRSRNNTITNNVIASKLPDQFVGKYESDANDLAQYGNFDFNYYLRPFEDVFKIRAVYNNGNGQVGADLSLTQWQNQYGKDQNSKNSPITYSAFALNPVGSPILSNSFASSTDGWGVAFSNQGNGRVEWDNTNRLDGGSLRISFPQPSGQGNSYVLASNNIGAVTSGKTYRLKFDAVATSATKRVEVILRQKFGSFSDLAPRSVIEVGTTRKTYELAFPASADESTPIIAFQINEDGQTIWFDNVELQEAIATPNNPDDLIRLVTNPTGQNATVSLNGTYRDAKNQAYSGSVTLTPFTSLLLLREGGAPSTPPTVTLREPENPANAVVGLDYRYYEGEWTTLPDFNALTPARTGTTNLPNLSVRGRDNLFGLRFTGFIDVPTDGTYLFYTASDDGSKLFIGTTEVVSHDGIHPPTEKFGSIGLRAGRHAITIVYFENAGGEDLIVSYNGPGISKQVIPASAFYRVDNSTPPPPPPPTPTLREPENPANAVAGLDYRYYEGNWTTLPDFNAITPVKTGTAALPDISPRSRDDFFGLRFTGFVNVPADGAYTFYVSSDDGSKLFIGSTEVVSHDGTHAQTEKSGSIGLKAGRHAITIVYFENNGGEGLSVSYSGPGLNKQAIPASAFFRVDNGTPPPPPPPTPNLREPENPANAVAGLDYRYYEGNWSVLPDFTALTPVKTGTASVVDLSQRNRPENYGLRFTGFVNVPADGSYTFYTNSDDGSKLFIGNTEVVNNDGPHGDQERSGVIGLKAGRHAITIVYFQATGGQGLSVSYSGPNVGKQTIPASALLRVDNGTPPPPPPPTPNLREPENPANAVAGLDYRYYEGNWNSLPDFTVLTPVKTGTASVVDRSARNREENYGLRFTGFVNVPADGSYTFYTNSDDGSKLFIGSTEVVNNDGPHGDQERSGVIGMKAGRHAITIVYFQATGGQGLSVSYSGPNVGKQTIPASAFFRVDNGTTPPPPPPAAGSGTGLRANYYNNRSLTAPLVVNRVDATIDFVWGDSSPVPGTVNADNYSVRWTGQVEAPATGSYTFSTTSDDGIRLWVNNVQIINNFTDHATTTDNGSITLSGGQRYDIRMEYYEATGGAVARLQWAYPGQGQQVVPQNRLYPAASGARTGVMAKNEVSSAVMYPVPAREQISVRYQSATAGVVMVELVNLLGQVVHAAEESVAEGENLIRVQVGQYSRGAYMLRLTQGGRRIIRKVILAE